MHGWRQGGEALALALKTNRTLQVLELQHNELGSPSAWHFGSALLVNTSLRELYLSSNHIADPGARALCDMLMSNHTLQGLMMGGNPLSSDLKEELTRLLIQRRHQKATSYSAPSTPRERDAVMKILPRMEPTIVDEGTAATAATPTTAAGTKPVGAAAPGGLYVEPESPPAQKRVRVRVVGSGVVFMMHSRRGAAAVPVVTRAVRLH